MRLSELCQRVDGTVCLSGGDRDVISVTDDSRDAGPGTLFVARRGAALDGIAFVSDALARGSVGVAVPESDAKRVLAFVDGRSALVTYDASRAALVGELAHEAAGNPSGRLRAIGVTGTNGKTTVTYLLRHLLGASGSKCGLVGTVVTDDGRGERASSLTTPSATQLAALLSRMVRHGCTAAAMEVSSHALDQSRVAGMRFACAVFTNLTGDHLDYHGSMDAYASAKARLFDGLGRDAVAIVNADDPEHARIVRDCAARVVRCSMSDASADCMVRVRRMRPDGMACAMHGPWGVLEADLPLSGRHNAMNALQALAVASALGVPVVPLERALSTCPAPPGRLEPVSAPGDGFAVLVDYAHTDDALLNVLRAVRETLEPGGRIITVFGCGGDRDRTKRPRMAAVACAHSDAVIVTSDNPRTEDPHAILRDILVGVPAGCDAAVEPVVDRAAAISRAVEMAKSGDAVIIAGKGHEDYQIVGTDRHPFDDRVVARAAIAARRSSPVGAVA
jgi:UDP-N-acetylmuramoyl-L-alanyl-D-glutamate--2,6-diaminopimelate ligase